MWEIHTWGKMPLRRARSRCKDSIQIILKEIVGTCGVHLFSSGSGPVIRYCEYCNDF